jgi:hypothetical protein
MTGRGVDQKALAVGKGEMKLDEVLSLVARPNRSYLPLQWAQHRQVRQYRVPSWQELQLPTGSDSVTSKVSNYCTITEVLEGGSRLGFYVSESLTT